MRDASVDENGIYVTAQLLRPGNKIFFLTETGGHTRSAFDLLTLLFRIHAPIGLLHHLLHVCRPGRPYCSESDGPRKTLLAFLQHIPDLCMEQPFRHIFAEKHKFVPSYTENIPAAKMLEEQFAQSSDIFVSPFVPEGIVHALEIVEVDEHDTEAAGTFFQQIAC